MREIIAYLGPPGTFSGQAANCFAGLLPQECRLQPCATVTACAEAAEDGEAKYAVVPLENSLEGSVHETLDVLTTGLELTILAELVLEIEHALLVAPGYTGDVTAVYSHPQALAQCRYYLRRNWPQAAHVPVLSTAEAAALVAREGGAKAAVGSIHAARQYGLEIVATGIQDSENKTRFVVLGKNALPGRKAQKTSLLFSVKNVAGSLLGVLQSFADHGVNLTRIESRPAKKQLGDYLFFVDLDGAADEPAVRVALRQAAADAVMLKLLGSYPILL